ncbi:hypothetical protein LCGC14_0381720 [marine sediment metagenome]|uniref:Uncharacterized protein n=1 Tax=marine sediment metagenome TaxID=412755 RepID=A0A0F9T1X9_9ZZZZ
MAHTYFWVFGVTREGKRILAGPFLDELEAANAEDDLEVTRRYRLPTRDRTKATSIVKQKLREDGVPTDDALKRISHRDVDDLEENSGGLLSGAKERFKQLGATTASHNRPPEEDIFEGDPFRD